MSVKSPETDVRQFPDSVKTVPAEPMETVRDIPPSTPACPSTGSGQAPTVAGAPAHIIASSPQCKLGEIQSPITGWIGFAVFTLFTGLATVLPIPAKAPDFSDSLHRYRPYLEFIWWHRSATMLIVMGLAMAFVELAVFKTHRRNFDFAAPREMNAPAWKRVFARWSALSFCMGVATVLYATLRFYNLRQFPYIPSETLDPVIFKTLYIDFTTFRSFFVCAVPIVVVFSVPYFWLVECYARTDAATDEFLILSSWLGKFPRPFMAAAKADPRQQIENAHVANLFRGLLVKFFYIPLMLVWTIDGFSNWEQQAHAGIAMLSTAPWQTQADVAMNFMQIHRLLFTIMLLVDISIACVGYVVSMRLLDNHMVSAEPTLLGWLSALLCYPPFRTGVTVLLISSPGDDIWPKELYINHSAITITVSIVMLSLWAVYVWATIAFGMRFSNLTNRGILCHGPYAYVRHPAYISKNILWWLEGTPFLMANIGFLPIFVVRMGFSNAIYGVRAWTEERHLMREPHYREYCKKVPWRFIPGVW